MTIDRHPRNNPHLGLRRRRAEAGWNQKITLFAASAVLITPLALTASRGTGQETSRAGSRGELIVATAEARAQPVAADPQAQPPQVAPPSSATPPIGQPPDAERPDSAADRASRQAATAMAERMIEYLTFGPPLEAKLRQRVWAAGREVVEVGRYEQAGRGTGRLRMELQVPIADGTSRWQQTCDGRLAWTREEMAGEVRVRRVDLGRLDEVAAPVRSGRVSPRLRVGGLAEIIDRIAADFILRLYEGHIEGAPMIVLQGPFREDVAQDLMNRLQRETWPELVPRQVRIAVPADALDAPLPSRIEFWTAPEGRRISLLEIYDVAEIEPPGIDQFRFEPGGDDFTNETELYLKRFSSGLAGTPLGSTRR